MSKNDARSRPLLVGSGTSQLSDDKVVRQAAIDLWRFFETRGFKVTTRMISRILRAEAGLRFREAKLRQWLAPFALGKKRDASGTQIEFSRDAAGTQNSLTRDAAGTHSWKVRDATGTRLRARAVKVLLVTNRVANATRRPFGPPPATLTLVPTIGGRKPKSEAEIAAYRITDAAVKLVWEYNRPAMTQKEWCRRNKRTALGMVEIGITPEQVTAVMHAAYTDPKLRDFYGRASMLDAFARNWSVLSESVRFSSPAEPRPGEYHQTASEFWQRSDIFMFEAALAKAAASGE